MSTRDELLEATSEAARLLDRFPVRNRTSFDVVGVFSELEIPLRFRPLNKLWGACIRVDGGPPGVLVTTVLDLAVQRFTLAHELGHVLLGHEFSLDETVGFRGQLGPSSRPAQERAADTFASELLAPRSLLLAASKRRGWTRKALTDPLNIYQLALRLGVSYQAACWSLAGQGVLPRAAVTRLSEQTVKDLKLATASEELITDSWANVWKLGDADSGSYLEAGPNDLFAVELSDNASAGFLWQLVDAGPAAEIVGERTELSPTYGEASSRTVWLRLGEPGTHRLTFEHRRRWNDESIAHIDIAIQNHGKESGGRSRRAREAALGFATL